MNAPTTGLPLFSILIPSWNNLEILKITLGNPEGFGYLKKLKIKKWVASYMSLLLLGAVGCPFNIILIKYKKLNKIGSLNSSID